MYVSLKKACVCAILSNGFFSTLKYHLSFMVEEEKEERRKVRGFFSLSYMASDMTTSVNLLPLKKTQRIIINFSVRCCLYTDAHSYQFFLSQCKKHFYLIKLEKRNKFHEAHKRKKKVTHSKSSHE